MKRLALYIDGFNLYHALNDLRQPELKWLDLWKLAELVAHPSETVVAVRYFSAYATWLRESYKRHRAYVAALQAQGVDTIMAHFKEKAVTCKKCGSSWTSREEKETDVHIGLRILADAEDAVFDRGMLVTADSDLVPVVRMLKQRHPDRVIAVAAPPRRHSHARHLQQVADTYFQIGNQKVRDSLLPPVVHGTGNQQILRPSEYAPRT